MKGLIESFYQAFQENDGEKMVNCYHDDITFEDPAFGKLEGERAKNMWRMFCEIDGERKIAFSELSFNEKSGSVRWEAHYTFSKTGRKVHNKIYAEFEFQDGKIIKHTDHFNLYSWAKQALGVKGLIFGGTNFFQKKLIVQTNALLTKFEDKRIS